MSCLQENCNEKAIYGYKQKEREYCKLHKKDKMVTKCTQYCSHNVLKSLCETCRGIDKKIKTIKKEDIDDNDNTCKVQGCINIIYGYRQQAPTRCKNHKLPEMVTHPLKYCEHNIRKYQCKTCKELCVHYKDKDTCDICNKKCSHGNIEINCKECRVEKKNQKKRQKCEHGHLKRNCKVCNPSGFCPHGKRINQCKECGGSSMCIHGRQKSACKDCKGSAICEHGKQKNSCVICNPSIQCKMEQCETMASNPLYKGYCLRCFVYTFPNEKVSRNHKTKEKTVVDFVLDKFDKLSWICDKMIDGGCSRRRPDMYLDLGSHVLIVEIDENSHKAYDCTCSNRRLMQLSQDFAHRPIVFIRINPDGYTDVHDKYINSPWRICKSTGIQIIERSKKNDWKLRMNILCYTIQYWLDNHTDKTIEVIELFYDKYIHKIVDKHYENKEARRRNIEQRKIKDRPTLEQLLKDLEDIGNFKGVGKKYDVNDNTIRKWLTKYNYEVKCEICQQSVKSFAKICRQCKRDRIPSLEQLEDDYKELKTYNKIAEKYDVTMYTIKWWFEKMRKET